MELRLLGTFRIAIKKRSITQFEANTARALLAYLVTHPDPQPREYLAQLLWANQENGLVNLRAALTRLREAIGDKDAELPLLLAERQTIQVNPERSVWVDVLEFETELEQVKKHRHRRLEGCPLCISRLTHVGNLIQGEFLLDIYVNSLSFEEWLLAQREHYRRLSVQIFATLTNYHLNCGNYTEAEHYARCQLHLEPWRETAHQQLMRALFENSQRTVALTQYKICRMILEKELGVQPMEQTTALYRKIRDAPFQQAPDNLSFSQTGSLTQLRRGRFPNNLPPSETTFYGREREMTTLLDLMVDPANRLVTLVGEGGIGKTRLALAAAKKLLPAFQDGVWFVSLTDVPTAQDANEAKNALALSTVSSLNIALDPHIAIFDQLKAYFHNREMLLIIDNLEHLLNGKLLLATWLERAPKLSLLITSREPLNFQREQVFHLTGLPVPENITIQEALNTPALQLFTDRIHRGLKKFDITTENLPKLIAICQFLQGHPLEIELVTAWVSHMSLEQILTALQENQVSLHGAVDIPERHRSMEAVYHTSWVLLTPPQKELLASLSIFQGGFTAGAVTAVLGSPAQDLDFLRQKSLLQISDDGHYSLHELLRQFAMRKLEDITSEVDALLHIRKRYCSYYLEKVRHLEAGLFGPTPYLALPSIQLEWRNIQQAWQWAVENSWVDLLANSLDALSRYYMLAGTTRHSDTIFGLAAQQFLQAHALSEEASILMGRLLVKQSHFFRIRRNYPQAWDWASQALAHAQKMRADKLRGESYYALGQVLHLQGFFPQATEYYLLALEGARRCEDMRLETRCLIKLDFALTHSLACNLLALEKARALEDGYFIYKALHQLGISESSQGYYAVAKRYLDDLLENTPWLAENHPSRSRLYGDLGEVSRQLGDYPQALTHYQQALQIVRYRGDQAAEISILDGLSRSYRCMETYPEAMHAAQTGLEISRASNNPGGQMHLLNSLGHILTKTQALEQAAEMYRQALQISQEVGTEAIDQESYAGLAEIAFQTDDDTNALIYAQKVITFLESSALDFSLEPMQIYLKCYRVLNALHAPQAEEILRQGYTLLQKLTQAIEDQRLRDLFLQKEVNNQALLEYWQMKDKMEMSLLGS